MKVKIQLWLGLLVLAAGCAAHKDKIVFNDGAELRAVAASAVTSPTQKNLAKADERKIEQLIFSYLLERHFWDLADYSAVFLSAGIAKMVRLVPLSSVCAL